MFQEFKLLEIYVNMNSFMQCLHLVGQPADIQCSELIIGIPELLDLF